MVETLQLLNYMALIETQQGFSQVFFQTKAKDWKQGFQGFNGNTSGCTTGSDTGGLNLKYHSKRLIVLK